MVLGCFQDLLVRIMLCKRLDVLTFLMLRNVPLQTYNFSVDALKKIWMLFSNVITYLKLKRARSWIFFYFKNNDIIFKGEGEIWLQIWLNWHKVLKITKFFVIWFFLDHMMFLCSWVVLKSKWKTNLFRYFDFNNLYQALEIVINRTNRHHSISKLSL